MLKMIYQLLSLFSNYQFHQAAVEYQFKLILTSRRKRVTCVHVLVPPWWFALGVSVALAHTYRHCFTAAPG